MKKCVCALLMALCLLSYPVQATQASTANFVRSKTYTGQFSDLQPDSTFYDHVSALYEYGLSIGTTNGTYGLKDPLTTGQAIIFAARIRSLYRTGDPEAGPAAHREKGQLTAAPYLLYLQAEGALDTALDDHLTAPITRAEMAHVLANILPEDALPAVHSDLVTEAYASRRAITDVTEYTPYFQDILSLYRKGICIGSDKTGSFLPNDLITRGAAAAMLTRMIDPALRVTPQWTLHDIPDAASRTLAGLITPGRYIASPTTEAEMDESIRYMLASGSQQLTLRYAEITVVQARQVMEQALSIVKTYCEQSYNAVECTFSASGTITLTFSAASTGDQLSHYRVATMDAAIAVHDQLWKAGELTTDMTEMEKAEVYYNWVCQNCMYDFSAGDDSLSHIPYSLFYNGTAVCDGYTGAYNLLLKLEGIDCTALTTKSHIWTVATLDGTEYHIDTTWGDSDETASSLYFAMTPEQSYRYHPW